MAKLPRGLRLVLLGRGIDENGRPVAHANVHIAWWAWPGIMLWGVREFGDIRWWQWPLVYVAIFWAWAKILKNGVEE